MPLRTLHLLRHAKSSWSEPGMEDHDRPLNPRGRKAARAMGRFLAEAGPVPEQVLCSSAVRTRETWDRVRKSLAPEPAVSIERDLYLATPSELLRHVRGVDPAVGAVLVIAHNPGTEDLARQLAGSGDEEAWHRMRAKYPTAGLATLRFEVPGWGDVGAGGGELVRFVVPRDL